MIRCWFFSFNPIKDQTAIIKSQANSQCSFLEINEGTEKYSNVVSEYITMTKPEIE